MPHAASIYRNGYSHSITPEVLHRMSRQQRWQPRTIVNSAPSQRQTDAQPVQTEAQLVMDRLLRECLTCKSP
jgi:hypothetical protein